MTIAIDPINERLEAEQFPVAEQDLRAAAIMTVRIGKKAREGQGLTIPYSDLVDGVKFQLESMNLGRPFEIRDWTSQDRQIVGEFLGFISRDTFRRGRFFASALVVHKSGDGWPAPAFFEWARRIGMISDLGDDSKMRFWVEQLKRAHAWYSTHPVEDVHGITSTPNVCDGVACVAGTRIPVWVLEQARRLGSSQAEVKAAYPTLNDEDLYRAWLYAAGHTDLIEQQIRENEGE
jgi:uncharacterized protein (DUF433 family)